HSVSRQQNISEQTAQKIDAEIRRLVENGLDEARQILTEKRDDLETLAQGLLEYETLSGDEIRGLPAGQKPVRDSDDDTPTARASAVPSTKGAKAKPSGEEPEGPLAPQPQA